MAFSFSQFGGAQQAVTQLAEENEQSSGGLMPPQKNNMFLIERVEIKPAANSASVQCSFMFNCIGEKYSNRKVFNSINVINKQGELNPIGERQIGAIANAVGFQGVLDNPEDLLQYANVPFVADVKIEAGQNGYEDRNVLANWKIANGQVFQELPMPAPKQAAPQFNQQAAPQAGGWAKPQQAAPQQSAPQAGGFQQHQQAAPQQAAPQFNNASQEVPAFLRQGK